MKPISFTHLEWDTNFFNYKVAEIKNQDILKPELEISLNYLKKQDYVLIYLFLDKEIENKLGSYILELVDTKITYVKSIKKTHFAIENINKYESDYPNIDLINLAIESGGYSRFNTDKNIKKCKFKELYKQWMINSVNKKIASDVLTYKEGNSIMGMVTLGEKNKRGDIGIIAVNKNYRGKKIATKLINAAEIYFEKKCFSEMQVVTQSINKPACKLYEKNDFKIDKIEYVYHIWL